MAALSNGEFVLVGEGGQLLLLENTANPKPQIIYGGEVLAFAWNGDETIMALILPPSPGLDSHVVRLYTFTENELGDMLGEVINANATQLLWAGTHHLVVCGPTGCTIYTWNNEKLKVFVSDSATSAFLQADRVALFYERTQTLQYWNLDTNRMMDSIKLLLRGCRLVCVVGSGYFGFALYDNGTVQAFYVTKSSIKKLQVFGCFFTMKTANTMTGRTSPPLLVYALSSRKVLIGLRNANCIHKLEYRNEKVLLDSMQEELPSPHVLVAILHDGQRCLTLNTETGNYHTLEISLGRWKPVVDDDKERKQKTTGGATDSVNTCSAPPNGSMKGAENHPFVPTSLDFEDKTKSKNVRLQSPRVNKNDKSGKETPFQFVITPTKIAAAGVALVVVTLLVRRVILHGL